MTDRNYHRCHGYKSCLRDNKIPYDKELLVQTDYSLSSGRDSIRKLLDLPCPPTAVFCSNNCIVLGAIKGAREKGLTLYNDLSVVGFDDMQTSSYMAPALTMIRQPANEMCRPVAELLLAQVEQPSKPIQDMMDVELVVR